MKTHTEQLQVLLKAVAALEDDGYTIANTTTSSYDDQHRIQLSHGSKIPSTGRIYFESDERTYLSTEMHGALVWWAIDKPEQIEEAA